MPSKRQHDQWEMTELRRFKRLKREMKSLAQFLTYLVQLQLDDNKTNTSDTSDTESESGTWFWHESANERDSDSEEQEYSNVEESFLEEEQPSHEGSTRLKSQPKEVKCNEDKLRGVYGKGSLTRQRKSIKWLELEVSKTYKFGALSQRQIERLTSAANTSEELAFFEESVSINQASTAFFLFDIFCGCIPPLSQ